MNEEGRAGLARDARTDPVLELRLGDFLVENGVAGLDVVLARFDPAFAGDHR